MSEPRNVADPFSAASSVPTINPRSGRRVALLLTVDHYEHSGLAALTASEADGEALASVLGDPDLGNFEVQQVRNPTSSLMLEQIEEVLANARSADLILLWFSGHGLKDDAGLLFLATSNSAPERLASTAVESAWVTRMMERCRAQHLVLVLDCCYGGAFERGMIARAGPRVDIGDHFSSGARSGQTRIVITSSTAMEYAFEGSSVTATEADPPRTSVFAGAVVKGIRTGEADRDADGYISVDDLYDYVYDEVRRVISHQTPSKWEFGSRSRIYLARNPRFPSPATGSSSTVPVGLETADTTASTGTFAPGSAGASLGRPLPHIRRDTASNEDLIGIRDDVRTLSSLIAARVTQPPLAIALLGEWGAGKSTVMTQVRDEVQILADSSRRSPEESSFVANVRQVTFNAWHYSDDHVWTGLIAHMFDTLAKPDVVAGQGEPADTTAVREDIARLRQERDRWKADDERLTKQLADAAQPTTAFVTLRSPRVGARLFAETLRQLARELRERAMLVLLWAALATVACGTWILYRTYLIGIVAAALTVLPPLAVWWRRMRDWHRNGVALTDLAKGRLERRLTYVRTNLDQANSRIAELDAAERLSRFLDERRSAATYHQRRGLLGEVHNDLDRLSGALEEATRQWRAHTGPDAPTDPPLERIVLYIDDLDRCPPQRVVEVLAAVHLMLALPLFVVIVAVDPRWLLNSLGHHYREMFISDEPDTPRTATPLDYLDKIFQIPYAVPEMGASAASRFVTALLDVPAPGALRRVPAAESASSGPETLPEPGPTDESRETATPSAASPSAQTDRAPQAESDEETPPTVTNLRPPGLVLADEEISFLADLAPLISTPRGAKRLVNLYRLVRIGVADEELTAFTQSQAYRLVQVLLVVLVGAPTESCAIFGEIGRADPSAKFTETIAGSSPFRRRLLQHISAITDGEDPPWNPEISQWQSWCPLLARYSFHTRELADIER